MAINFDEKIFYIKSSKDIRNHMEGMNPRPSQCPVCKHDISPQFILVHEKQINHEAKIKEVLCGCPNPNCDSLFFVVYDYLGHDGNQRNYRQIDMYPYFKEKKEFPKRLSDLSPSFVTIYNQAFYAEQENLDLICGVGYRKALEFLIKDYVITLEPTKKEDIKKTSLVRCIKDHIQNKRIVSISERASWLGNDETHYERKWKNKDVQDLKTLIELTCKYIDMELAADEAELGMQKS